MGNKAAIMGVAGVVFMGGFLGYIAGISRLEASGRIIPLYTQVQQGYIAPSKLEIQCIDVDGNGELETIMKINNKSYFLKEIEGKPVLLSYIIEPAKIIIEK